MSSKPTLGVSAAARARARAWLARLLAHGERGGPRNEMPPAAGAGGCGKREVAGVMACRQKAAEGPADGQLTG
jgi:hypothetical protein